MNPMYNKIASFYSKIGPRSNVWTEKEMVEAAAFEFSEVRFWGIKGFFLMPLW